MRRPGEVLCRATRLLEHAWDFVNAACRARGGSGRPPRGHGAPPPDAARSAARRRRLRAGRPRHPRRQGPGPGGRLVPRSGRPPLPRPRPPRRPVRVRRCHRRPRGRRLRRAEPQLDGLPLARHGRGAAARRHRFHRPPLAPRHVHRRPGLLSISHRRCSCAIGCPSSSDPWPPTACRTPTPSPTPSCTRVLPGLGSSSTARRPRRGVGRRRDHGRPGSGGGAVPRRTSSHAG